MNTSNGNGHNQHNAQRGSIVRQSISSGMGDSPVSSGSSPGTSAQRMSRSQSMGGFSSSMPGTQSTPNSCYRAIRGSSLFRYHRLCFIDCLISYYQLKSWMACFHRCICVWFCNIKDVINSVGNLGARLWNKSYWEDVKDEVMTDRELHQPNRICRCSARLECLSTNLQ